MGHVMMTAGLHPQQFFWCNLCSSYTNLRARKLKRTCDRVNRSVLAVEALRQGFNPNDGTNLISPPRRLCKREVGSGTWSGEGRPDDNLLACTNHDHDRDDELCVRGLSPGSQHADEDWWDDPLGLGAALG